MAAKSTTLRKTARGTGPAMNRSAATIPSDALADWLDSDEEAPEPPSKGSKPSKASAPAAPEKAMVPTEPVIDRLMSGEHKSQFLLLADWFEAAIGRRPADVCVMTEVGDVHFEVIDWIDTPGFLKLVVDSSKMPFKPRAMARLPLRRKGRVYHTTCVSPLSSMFGDLPFAELILVVDEIKPYQPDDMEKNARIEEGRTPSAVSGKPSTGVDNDEPVADGEKAASVRGALPEADFDVSREAEED